jgi:hypothetical protein
VQTIGGYASKTVIVWTLDWSRYGEILEICSSTRALNIGGMNVLQAFLITHKLK